MDDVKVRRSPQQVKDYDNDLRRVRQMQQLQAEQDAKIKAQQLKEKKAADAKAAKEEREAKQGGTKLGNASLGKSSNNNKPSKKPTKDNKTSGKSSGNSNLSMNNFSTPSYRYVYIIFFMKRINLHYLLQIGKKMVPAKRVANGIIFLPCCIYFSLSIIINFTGHKGERFGEGEVRSLEI